MKSGATATGKTAWVKNYYDEYDFLSEPGFADGDYVVTGQDNGKGHLTGRTLRATDGDTIAELICYDEKGRESWVMRNNLLGEREIHISSYTYSGKPYLLVTVLMGEQLDSTSLIVGHRYTYDHSDRLSKVEHYLNTGWTTLAEYAYDNLDRLASKNLHGSATNQLTYSYNIRDWLTGISGTRFTQNLDYSTCYNGNISSMTWKSGNETTTRGYQFTYDDLSRMLSATYGEGTDINLNANRFTERVTGYDKNGNIKALQRYGQTSASAYGLIDNLTFTLDGNRPTRVDDAVSTAAYNNGFEFKDAVKQSGEYDYDYNGNLTKDLNRGIDTITYNFLNLPDKIEFSDGSTIEYVYAADGTKLRVVHTIGDTTTTTDYCGDVIYENGVRKYLLTEEGYVTSADNKYHYYLKDHQGNHRVVVDQNGTVEETNHYYPFGGVFASTASVQPYKYNGKEFDLKKGLNWYDYGARMYDPALGRFTTMDPMAESYYAASTYVYCGNNPVNRIDPNGMDWYQNNETKYYTWYEERLKREGYTYIGGKGSVLGEFEPIIDDILTGVFNRESLYSEGFTFDIVPNDKGALIGSDERGWDFLDEFVNGTGPEFSVFMSDHPYTEAMKSAKDVLEGQQRIVNGGTDIPGQITNLQSKWGLWDVLTTPSLARQFVGSYRYDAFTSKNGFYLNNVVSDSKSMSSLFYHLYPSSMNPNRAQQKIMGTTYQFYIWQSKK